MRDRLRLASPSCCFAQRRLAMEQEHARALQRALSGFIKGNRALADVEEAFAACPRPPKPVQCRCGRTAASWRRLRRLHDAPFGVALLQFVEVAGRMLVGGRGGGCYAYHNKLCVSAAGGTHDLARHVPSLPSVRLVRARCTLYGQLVLPYVLLRATCIAVTYGHGMCSARTTS